MFGRGVFLKGKNFHSIVIVVPLHVSKLYRVLKKLTAYLRPPLNMKKVSHRPIDDFFYGARVARWMSPRRCRGGTLKRGLAGPTPETCSIRSNHTDMAGSQAHIGTAKHAKCLTDFLT
jgi:hypothetical protein